MRRASGGADAARRGLVVVLTLASVLALTGAAVAATSGEAPARLDGRTVGPASQQGPTGPALAQSDIDPDVVVMRVDVEESGDARWQVEYRVRLDDDNATAAFTSVQTDIERNASAYTQDFATGMRRTVRTAANRTGREMVLENVTVTATNETLPQLYGVVTYEFRWTNFAAVDGDRIRMGDALAGLFLDAESSLSLSWPSGYETASVTPAATETESDRVVWRGPVDFGPDEPSVVVRPAGGLPTIAIGAAVALLMVGLVAGWVVVRRRRTDERASDVLADDDAAAGAGGAAADTGESEADSEQTAEADDESADAPPEELLSNEEKVLRLLDEHGGRIKQQEIASEYDWTDAKTSQVVGKLRDEDEVETFRIGRENVVTLPEESDL